MTLPWDELARQAQLDQADAGMAEMARSLRSLYLSLVRTGFSSVQALTLTATLLSAMLSRPQAEPEHG